MTKSAPLTPSAHLHPPVNGGVGSVGPRPGCDFVVFDNKSTVCHEMTVGSKGLLPGPNNTAIQWNQRDKRARFDLAEIDEDNRMQKKIIASQSGKP